MTADLHECELCGQESPETEMVWYIAIGWIHKIECLPEYLRRVGGEEVDYDGPHERMRDMEGR